MVKDDVSVFTCISNDNFTKEYSSKIKFLIKKDDVSILTNVLQFNKIYSE